MCVWGGDVTLFKIETDSFSIRLSYIVSSHLEDK